MHWDLARRPQFWPVLTAIHYMENRKLHEQYNVIFFVIVNRFKLFCCLDLKMPPANGCQLIGKKVIQESWVNNKPKSLKSLSALIQCRTLPKLMIHRHFEVTKHFQTPAKQQTAVQRSGRTVQAINPHFGDGHRGVTGWLSHEGARSKTWQSCW